MIVPNPCDKHCPRRSATCHVTCPDWAKYEKKRAEEYAERLRKKNGMYSICDRREVNAKYKYIMKTGKGVKTW